ncbi:RrF2 family transcriptional regulator [Maricaulis sp. D1M11]|uniref:RrF2 family transcriptional regulator n=1 Tax=Maricaulis sp. D1M11 TaxID=3076117 RepID=UPI0039B61EB4
MKLTTYSDYALRVMMYLAVHDDRRSTIAEIAEAYDISRNHLMKLVQDLARAGLVESTRGRSGGLKLGRDAGKIRVGQVIRLTESDIDLVECFSPGSNTCRITPACQLNFVLREALGQFLSVLDRYTIADLISNRDTLKALLEPEAPVISEQ